MSQESVPHLVNFVYEAFGAQCAALLMVGLDEEPALAKKPFYIQETVEGGEQHWEIEVVANTLPCRSEPLVLAALLKLLLRRGAVPSPLEFQMSEVLEELLHAGVELTPESVDRIIAKYVALSYDKRARSSDESAGAGGGMYSLLIGYLRGSVKEAGEIDPAQVSNSVQFDQSVVGGLRRGDVVLAGIRFGKLGQTVGY
jgi:hypothetical protein